jgi:hypothetical protein
MTRTNTPDRINADGSRTITTKRACNGCGELIGDITEQEMNAAIAGHQLPDVRRECPTCGPTAPPPACHPMQILAGDVYCIENDCDHDRDDEADYCDHVRKEKACAVHSVEVDRELIHAEPWPCKQAKAVAS